jgi:hypothetical protein
MKRFWSSLLGLLFLPAAALAMDAASVPPKFPIPWGQSAGGGYIRSIPQNSQIGIVNCAASLTDGFPPLTFTPSVAGGCPPFGQDMNGILKQITQWSRWNQAGGPVFWDSAFSTSIGGYPKGSVVQSNIVLGDFWLSTADNNTTNPDATGAGWVPLPGMASTGAVSWAPGPIPAGWVQLQSSFTIGSAASGASYAAADAQLLFVWTWTNCPNTQCAVSGGRGANGGADFAANKTIQVLDLSGTGVIGNDNSTGRLSGVPVVSGNGQTNLSIIGENLHTLSIAETPAHTHTGSGTTATESVAHTHTGSGTTGLESNDHTHQYGLSAIGAGANFPVGNPGTVVNNLTSTSGQSANHSHLYAFTTSSESALHTHSYSFTTSSVGGGGSHNTVFRTMVGTWIQKL